MKIISPAAVDPIVFTPGSKVIFVSGGYEGGRERVGVVLGLTQDNHVMLCMLDDEKPGAPSYIEGFDATRLAADIAEGRLEGSLAEKRYVRSVNPCLPLVAHTEAPLLPKRTPKLDAGYADEDPGDGGREGRRYGN